MKISFIIKENKRKKKQLNELIQNSKKLVPFSSINFHKTSYAGQAVELAKEQVENNVNVIIAVGGDGTLNEVLNGVLFHPYNDTIIGYFPLGTANDFAKTAGEIYSVSQFITCLNNISVKKINVGKITCSTLNSKSARYFINIADTGLGGFIAKRLTQDKRKLGAQLTYLKHTISGFFKYKKTKVFVKMDEHEYEGNLLSIAVCNGKVFSNGLIISPKAKLNDDVLQITLFGEVTLWDYMKNLKNLKKGNIISHKNIHYYSSKSIVVSSSFLIESEADGEYVGFGETSYEILPFTINLLDITS